MTWSIVGLDFSSSRTVSTVILRRFVERKSADAGTERREGDARGPDLSRARHGAADGGLDDRPARPAVAVEGDGMDDGLGREVAGGRHDRAAQRHGRLADRGELDAVTAGAFQRTADTGRHPERQIGRVHDGVDLQVADVPVPQLDACQTYPLRSVSVRIPTGPAAAWYTRGSRRAMAVTTSQEFVVRCRASSPAVIRTSPAVPQQHEFVRGVDGRPRNVGHIGHDRIHRDVADQRHELPADDRARPVRELPRPAVAIAERQRRDPARALGPEGRSVADAPAGRQVGDPDRPCHAAT